MQMKRHFSGTFLNSFFGFYSKAFVSALIAATSNHTGQKMEEKQKGFLDEMRCVRDTELFLLFLFSFLLFVLLFYPFSFLDLVKNEIIISKLLILDFRYSYTYFR